MAIKPTLAPPIFASLDDYAVDPLVPVVLQGTSTKELPGAVRLANGQIPNVPPFAQNENYILNLETLHSIWVSEGTEFQREDTHIVETGEIGEIAIISAFFGDWPGLDSLALEVKPNIGTVPGALFHTSPSLGVEAAVFQDVVAPGNQRALVVRCTGDSAVAPMLINSQDGEFGRRPGLQVEGDPDTGQGLVELNPEAGTALRIRHTGTALGGGAIDVETGASGTPINATQTSGVNPAIRATGGNGGANRSSPLVLVPQVWDTAGSGAQTGNLWVHEFDDGVTTHYSPRVRLRQTRYIKFSRFAICHARGTSSSATSDSDINTYTTLFDAAFFDDLVPSETVTMRINLKGEVRRDSEASTHIASNGVQFICLDQTAGGETVFEVSRDLSPLFPGTDNGNSLWKQFDITFDYLPTTGTTNGPREFRFRFRKRDAGAGSALLQVRNVFGTVDTLP